MARSPAPDAPRALLDARSIGERLQREAITLSDASGWFTVQRMQNGEWQMQPAALDLYSGLPGIVLFLAYLDHATGEDRHAQLARRAFANLRRMHRTLPEGPPGGFGAFTGLAGIAYLCSHLAVLWDDEEILHFGSDVAADVCAHVPGDRTYDWMGGSAGCIAALLSLYSVNRSPTTLSAAIACADRLLASAQPTRTGVGWVGEREDQPLAGIAHGSAGIALSLARLAEATGEQRFRDAAESALAYERSVFDESRGAWADLRRSRARDRAGNGGFASSPGWCNGSAGIAMSRVSLRSCPGGQDPRLEAEIRAGIDSCLGSAMPGDFSLCHGTAGNAELLTVARDWYDDAAAAEVALTSAMSRAAGEAGWKPPGLMDGLAGLGYALLRTEHPQEVPSVLLLSPPDRREGTARDGERAASLAC